MHEHKYECKHVCMYVCMCMHVCIFKFVFVRLPVSLSVCMLVCMYAYKCVCPRRNELRYTFTHIHTLSILTFWSFFVCLSFSIQSFWHTWSAQNPRVQNISIIQDSDLWDDREDWGGVGGSDLWGYSIFFFSIRYSVFADILWFVYTCIYLGVA